MSPPKIWQSVPPSQPDTPDKPPCEAPHISFVNAAAFKFNLKIDLEEGASPPLGTIYPMSPTELESLWEFINEHLSYSFI
ncbi:hypothetical protein PAXRUDRAFT_16067 [Paxillus rubicundulus Ve08.2h10]|uniref:Unplaced genomic scaffold scaffold_1325, whole genome shotgun sequence n=1 Tax=Paxillus rubicundulus Ve08.2h10 TaxID=930991 RepID=A0A0D0D8B7_9AGAM|nr:hypothetical protein PAXRUDRAFT_16067 [Paxillus rubicundulus Ve08.2h10]